MITLGALSEGTNMETIIGAKGADLKRRPDMTDFTHKRAFMDGVKTGREQNSAERKILLERINKLEEQLSAEKLAAGYWMEQSCRDHNRAEKAEQQMYIVSSMQETNKYNTSCRVHSQEVIINHVAHSITWSKQDCPYCEIDRLTAQLARYQSKYNNLLAVAHRDGGQYLAQHGEEKAGDDAITAILAAYHNNDRYQGGVEVEGVISEFGDVLLTAPSAIDIGQEVRVLVMEVE